MTNIFKRGFTVKAWISCVLVTAGALVAGCASDESGRPVSATEKANLSAIVDQMDTVKAMASGTTIDGTALIDSIDFGDFEDLINPTRSGFARTRPIFAMLPDCAMQNGATWTFVACDVMGHSVDGTVSLAGDTVTADLTDTFSVQSGEAGTAHVTGAVTVTPTSLAGTANLDLNFMVGTESHDIVVTATFTGVVLCPADLPSAGTLVVTGAGMIGEQAVNVTRTITFGPECGQATID